ncbi:MAG: hypothetical protein HY043_10430 [Verrucomicrobia bacterium]|nr:hypothetical protein [Verrucomicrobiota bacterium]
MKTSSPASKHPWRFFRAGGMDQVQFDSEADFANLEHLDQKLWVALSCPVKGLEFDEKTLALIDTDKDGRVRAPEVIAAVQWAEDHLKDLGELKKASDSLPLSSINNQTDSGKAILASAQQILKSLGKPEATAISLADLGDTAKIFAATKFNGDGIVPADSADNADTKQVILDIIVTLGAETDRSGAAGVSQAKVDAFFGELAALEGWCKQSEENASTVLPLGDKTAAALAAYNSVKHKVDDYFSRCRLAAFDARAVAALNRPETEYLALAAKDLSITAQEVAGFPLARIEAGKPLPLKDGVNPAWTGAVMALASDAVAPLVGKDKTSLSESEWASIGAKLSAYAAWMSAKPATAVEKLSLARVRAILGSKAKEQITALIAKDKALEPEANSIISVERLVRYYRDLFQLLNNFVSFTDFYSRERLATFQVGTLYLDGRACELCVRVEDAGKHGAMAGMAKAYLAYCDCTRPSGEKMQIAAAFTGGDGDNLMVGRNGIFYDRKGRDWDAAITKIIDNPISVRQSFFSPYKKFVRLIEEQVAKRAAAADAAAQAKLAASAAAAANADKTKAPPPPPAEPKKVDPGTVAAMGVAVGFIGSAFAAIAGYLFQVINMPFWQVCVVLIGLVLLISGPSMIIAWFKLRQRNLGPILDANGWAVNGRVRMNVPFGGSLTALAKLPPGAQAAVDERFVEKPATWPKFVVFVIAVCFVISLLNSFGINYAWLKSAMNGESNTMPAVSDTTAPVAK